VLGPVLIAVRPRGAVRPSRSAAAAGARSKWAQLKTDAAAKMDDLQARIDKRADQIDANAAASDAAWAEDDAAAAIDYASWTVDNARLAVLDAIDARAYADELATRAGT
jgi:glycerol-3-phosphate dehydrogenase